MRSLLEACCIFGSSMKHPGNSWKRYVSVEFVNVQNVNIFDCLKRKRQVLVLQQSANMTNISNADTLLVPFIYLIGTTTFQASVTKCFPENAVQRGH